MYTYVLFCFFFHRVLFVLFLAHSHFLFLTFFSFSLDFASCCEFSSHSLKVNLALWIVLVRICFFDCCVIDFSETNTITVSSAGSSSSIL